MVRGIFLLLGVLLALPAAPAPAQEPARGRQIQVCATTPDLGALTRAVGGPRVAVTVFAKDNEDPHFLEARPAMILALSRADLLVRIGLDLEAGWLPVLVESARNRQVMPGQPGDLDASRAIRPRSVHEGLVDRSMGDVHAGGNPHFLTDPLCGLAVARALRDRLTTLAPEGKEDFATGYETLRSQLGVLLVGESLSRLYDFEQLVLLHEHGRLASFLEEQEDHQKLGGLFGELIATGRIDAVADHDLWPYFAARFGIRIHGFFEPKPGVPPTTRHLAALIQAMKKESVTVVLAVPYFNERHARFVAEHTGARIAQMAHQTGARPGCEDYVLFIQHNVRSVIAAAARQ